MFWSNCDSLRFWNRLPLASWSFHWANHLLQHFPPLLFHIYASSHQLSVTVHLEFNEHALISSALESWADRICVCWWNFMKTAQMLSQSVRETSVFPFPLGTLTPQTHPQKPMKSGAAWSPLNTPEDTLWHNSHWTLIKGTKITGRCWSYQSLDLFI